MSTLDKVNMVLWSIGAPLFICSMGIFTRTDTGWYLILDWILIAISIAIPSYLFLELVRSQTNIPRLRERTRKHYKR